MKTKLVKMATVSGLAVAAALGFAASTAWSIEYDLTTTSVISVPGAVGGTAIVANYWEQPAGTGVFEPFLTIQRTPIEQGYNTDGSPLYMDETRPTWNTKLSLGSLADVDVNGTTYHAFILDANEPGANKSTISIDNLRIYTSATDNTGVVGSDPTMLDSLGTLRWALNDPTLVAGGFNAADWIKLDSDQENVGYKSNGGSGQADMIVYVPVSAFGNASDSDFVWFYNLNGVKYSADANLAAQSGFEEWRAVLGPTTVPDGGMAIGLLGMALAAMGFVARKLA